MNKHDIEARLHRSLASQVRVPKLDRRFDAAVWARIEAETSARPVAPVVAASSAAQRWLLASNIVGFVVAAVLVLNFGARMLSGVHLDIPAMPSWSPGLTEPAIKMAGWAITGAALAFGLMFTSLGRRLRSEFT